MPVCLPAYRFMMFAYHSCAVDMLDGVPQMVIVVRYYTT